MKVSHFLMMAAMASAIGLSHAPGLADDAGSKALTAAETAMNKAKTLYLEYEATTTEAGKADKKVSLNVFIKGDKRLIEFTAPNELKGTKFLVLSPTDM